LPPLFVIPFLPALEYTEYGILVLTGNVDGGEVVLVFCNHGAGTCEEEHPHYACFALLGGEEERSAARDRPSIYIYHGIIDEELADICVALVGGVVKGRVIPPPLRVVRGVGEGRVNVDVFFQKFQVALPSGLVDVRGCHVLGRRGHLLHLLPKLIGGQPQQVGGSCATLF
jgi:hypothetical protein